MFWVANNADKKGLKSFVDGQYRNSSMPKPKSPAPPPKKVKNDWNRLAGAMSRGFRTPSKR